MVEISEPDDETREQAALAWLVRLHGRPSRAERRAFDAWASDPANQGAFVRAEALWRRTERPAMALAQQEGAALDRLATAAAATPPREGRIWRTRIAVATMCLAVVSGGLWLERPHLLQDLAADLVTARGERREVALSDGSTALLDADTALDLQVTEHERRLRLLRGRAFFQVRPSAAPFVVEAAAGEVRVLGTAFAVAVEEAGTTVTVLSGRVQVTSPGGSRAVLGRAQQARYRLRGGIAVSSVDAEGQLAWREGRLAFQQATLREVVARLERHRPGRILILDPALAERRVTGSFAAADTEAALASLQAILGFRRQDLTAHLVTLR